LKEDSLPQINRDSLPPVESLPQSQPEPLPPIDPPPPLAPPIPSVIPLGANVSAQQPPSRFSFLKKKIFFILLAAILIIGIGSGGVFYYLNQRVTTYTLIPDDTQFYLGLSVKKHPQVQKLLTLSKKLPGGEKMVKQIDKYRSEIFGTRKDPFKEILNLAETEVFLAKISEDEQSNRSFGVNTLEQLVNIVQFKNSKEATDQFEKLENNENITTTKEAYASAQIAKFEEKSQKENENLERFSTGPLPYQVTLPLSKSIFATFMDKFVIAAEKENDIKKIIDLATGAKDKKFKSITTDKEHNEIVSHFPKEYLLKFYQRQVLDPLSNITAGTTLPQNFLFGQRYDTRQRNSKGDNVFTTKRGLTIVAQDNGVDFTSYQLTKKSGVTEGLKHGFTIETSLANKLPAVFDTKQPLFYAEVKNIKGSIQDQLDYLADVAKNSSDGDQKKAFEDAIKGIEEVKKQVKDVFGVDVDSDLLLWMDQNAALIFAPGFGGKAPEALFVFEVKDPQTVESKLSKLRMKNVIGSRSEQAKNSLIKSDVGQIATGLQAYYTTGGKGLYPNSLSDLVSSGELKTLPKAPGGKDYGYLRCDNGQEAAVFQRLEETEVYWAFSSKLGKVGYINQTSPPTDCNFDVMAKASGINQKSMPIIEPAVQDYQNNRIFSIPIYDYQGDKFALRYVVTDNLAIFSVGASDQSLKDIIDFQKTDTNTLASDSRWKEQFAKSPKNIGAIVYIVPENIMGVADYFLSKEQKYKEYVDEDWMVILRGYLKALKSIGTTTTQEGKTIISSTFVNIEELEADEARKVEEALDRVFSGKSDLQGSSIYAVQSRDAQRKSDIRQISTVLQASFTIEANKGKGTYPNSLHDLVPDYLTTLPKSPSGEDYGYLRCANGKEAAVFAKLESIGTYWVWSSASRKAIDIKSMNPPSTTCIYGL